LQVQLRAEYQSLRSALLAGGATPETLDALINSPPVLKQPSGHPWCTDAPVFVPAASQSFQKCVNRTSSPRDGPTGPSLISISPDSFEFEDEKSSFTSSEKLEGVTEDCGEEQETRLEEITLDKGHEDRTLLLKGLSNRTTLADIAKAVRGGQVLNLYIREQERTAHVSFVNPLAAKAFLIYAKRADLYVSGKRVSSPSTENK